MRTYNANFDAKNRATSKTPHKVVELAFDFAGTDLHYFTSHPDTALPGGAASTKDVVAKVTSTSQKLDPIRALSTIGAITVTLVDASNSLTSLINSKLSAGSGLRGKRVRVYVGYEGDAWADYELVQTQIIDSVTFDQGSYVIRCADVLRSAGKDRFDLAVTNLTATVSETDTTIPVKDTTGFEALAHGTSFTDAPGQEVVYFRVDDEIIRCPASGITSNSFTGVTRGALNTKAVRHEVDATADDDRKPKIEEVVYLEMPAAKLALAILTGDLYNQAGKKLPSKWHLGIDPQFVRTSDFTGIGTDWWDPNDDAQGVVLRFVGEKKQDAKRFIEEQLNRALGAFNPIYRDGQLGLRRMTVVVSDAAHVRELNESNLASYGALKHDMQAVHNQFQIDWNWDPINERYTRSNLLLDANSISRHGAAPPLSLKFRGLHGSRHTQKTLAQRFDSLRSRHAGPPLRISINTLHSQNDLEVGDVVRLKLDNVRDFTGGTTSIDRAFEIQGTTIDWVTGSLRLDLFGSAEKAGAIAATSATTVLAPSFYTSAGTELKTYLDTNYPGAFVVVGGVGHIQANCTLPGANNMNANAAIYYYDGPLEIDNGITVTITKNLQLRANGHIQFNGRFDGKGQGIAGVSATETPGTPGFIGITKAGGGASVTVGSAFHIVTSEEATPAVGSNTVFPDLSLDYNGTFLAGIPDDLRGTSGGSGHDIIRTAFPNINELRASGGAGAAGGAGLAIICKGLSASPNGEIDLSGADGAPGSYDSLTQLYAGSGAGGAPGGCLVLIDGGTVPPPDNPLTAKVGNTPVTGKPVSSPFTSFLDATDPTNFPAYSHFTGIGGIDSSQANFHFQYLPENLAPQPDVSEITSVPTAININEIQNKPPTPAENLATLEVSVAAPSDGNYSYSNIYYRIFGQTAWTLAGPTSPEAIIVVPMDGTKYEISARPVSIFGVESQESKSTTYTVATAQGGVVLQPGNYIKTSPTVGQPSNGQGVEVTETAIKGYDASGNVKFTLDAATGLLTATDANITGTITATAGAIGGWTVTANSISKGNITLDAANSRIQAGPDASTYVRIDASGITGVDAVLGTTVRIPTDGSPPTFSGTITATAGAIGGWAITANAISKGNVTLDAANSRIQAGPDASTYVRIDASGITGVDAVLGTTVRIPTDGSPPQFSSGQITNTIYEISTSGILRTSATVGDGSASSQGVLINDTGIKGFPTNSSTPTFFLDANTGEITAVTFKTTNTAGKRIEVNPNNDNELHFYADRGDGVVEELATIGINSDGTDWVVGFFGNLNAGNSRLAMECLSYDNMAIVAKSVNDVGGYFISTNLNAMQGFSTNSYGGIFWNTADNKAPILLMPAASINTPTHVAAQGALFVGSDSSTHINVNGGTSWKTFAFTDNANFVTGGNGHDHAGGDGAPIPQTGLASAVQNKLVTNGNSHDHSGGDGAQIPQTGLASAVQNKLVTNGNAHNHLGGDGGAIPEGGLAAAAVDQSSLKTALQQNAANIPSAATANIILSGGGFSLMFGLADSGLGTTYYMDVISRADVTNYTWGLGLRNQAGASLSYYFQARYVQASPPYNLGNGDIPLFVFMTIDDSTGDVVAVDVAEDPPWANNGPTNIRPDFHKNGKKYQKRIVLPNGKTISRQSPNFNSVITPHLSDPASREIWLDAIRNPVIVNREITRAIKNADIAIVPHPFMGTDMAGKTIVMLDPIGKFCLDMHCLYQQGADITEIIRGYTAIGNVPLSANGPPGIAVIPARWKNTM